MVTPQRRIEKKKGCPLVLGLRLRPSVSSEGDSLSPHVRADAKSILHLRATLPRSASRGARLASRPHRRAGAGERRPLRDRPRASMNHRGDRAAGSRTGSAGRPGFEQSVATALDRSCRRPPHARQKYAGRTRGGQMGHQKHTRALAPPDPGHADAGSQARPFQGHRMALARTTGPSRLQTPTSAGRALQMVTER